MDEDLHDLLGLPLHHPLRVLHALPQVLNLDFGLLPLAYLLFELLDDPRLGHILLHQFLLQLLYRAFLVGDLVFFLLALQLHFLYLVVQGQDLVLQAFNLLVLHVEHLHFLLLQLFGANLRAPQIFLELVHELLLLLQQLFLLHLQQVELVFQVFLVFLQELDLLLVFLADFIMPALPVQVHLLYPHLGFFLLSFQPLLQLVDLPAVLV